MKKTALILMIIALLSKSLGFIREILMSYYFGASFISDAYFISLTIPVVIFSFISIGISTGFIPIFNKIITVEDVNAGNKFTNNVITLLIILCTVIFVVVQVFIEDIVKIFAIGFDSKTLSMAIAFTRISMFGVYFTGMIAVYEGYLQSKNKFILPACFGFIYNFFVIIFIFVSYKVDSMFLVLGNVVALIVQFILLAFSVYRENLKWKFTLDNNQYIKDLGKLVVPLIFSISITQINVLIDKTLASKLSVGGISSLNYADRLNSFILSIVVMSISISIYPTISRLATEKLFEKLKAVIIEAMIIISVILIPATVVVIIFSKEIVELVFGRGAFDTNAVTMTASGFLFYSIGMIGIGLREILSRTFFSMQDVRTPVKNAAIGMIINIGLNLLLSKYLGIGGLALATSISALITTALLFNSIQKKIGNLVSKHFIRTLIKVIIASFVMGVISKLGYEFLVVMISEGISLVITLVFAIGVYLILISFFKIKEFQELINALKNKIPKTR